MIVNKNKEMMQKAMTRLLRFLALCALQSCIRQDPYYYEYPNESVERDDLSSNCISPLSMPNSWWWLESVHVEAPDQGSAADSAPIYSIDNTPEFIAFDNIGDTLCRSNP